MTRLNLYPWRGKEGGEGGVGGGGEGGVGGGGGDVAAMSLRREYRAPPASRVKTRDLLINICEESDYS